MKVAAPHTTVKRPSLRISQSAQSRGHSHNEDPLPTALAGQTVHVQQTRSQETREGACERGRGEVERNTLAEVGAAVERGEVRHGRGQDGTLACAEEETRSNETRIVVDEALEGRYEAPGDTQDGDEDVRATAFVSKFAGLVNQWPTYTLRMARVSGSSATM